MPPPALRTPLLTRRVSGSGNELKSQVSMCFGLIRQVFRPEERLDTHPTLVTL